MHNMSPHRGRKIMSSVLATRLCSNDLALLQRLAKVSNLIQITCFDIMSSKEQKKAKIRPCPEVELLSCSSQLVT